MKSILLIEDDVAFSSMLKRFLEKHNYNVSISYGFEDAKAIILKEDFDLIFTDLRLPDGDGLTLLEIVKKHKEKTPVILMTGYAEVSTAVKAMKQGAIDYISKPFNQDEVLHVINNALNSAPVVKAPAKKVESKVTDPNADFVTGISSSSKKLNEYIHLVGPTDMSVLITGESGTGKEVVAKSIHKLSLRKNKPFVAVDCGAIPKEIAASEFFGHKKGSFTGAINDKKGHFESANHGTLFLDEVGNLSYENQIQLLRALQERRIKPIGSSDEIEVDIRLITATNEDLMKAVDNGDFREDLYHRLNEFTIKIPNLHERKDDLIIFADYFLSKANEKLNKNVIGFSDDVLKVFHNYTWPGNLREFGNVIKRATLLTSGDFIQINVLPAELTQGAVTAERPTSTKSFSTKDNEKDLIIRALEQANNNKTQAAKLLNVTRKTLYNKIKEYNISL
ncbi:sigma-54-dependent transcriptional regulator [Formosa algae]|uniref:Two-component system response regulator HydG n=1 Tax=Formosa algae TaxID=225843 RepID=A0A9X0YMI5_9FLAO|nr:sigma-54 dependent transcriptional regulator [Formosa algae]MBP1839967.1 two-component system response regulator HydG [Formosa algae]MDQ0335566.1 two-component system response regulator HydG [Formosa algae]OEI81735.1 sigma-54-dependent Fis family transcriptional regulator [Formosa algae]PNW28668.1 sigma-54-dependent Fis family transcriptional regulator [Formosa algae]